uniref:Uncharacterized protein n=1 Tax=Lepeophtheirus salmonis TaxID=72036 RepID=A0A0K2UTU3_LEPSM
MLFYILALFMFFPYIYRCNYLKICLNPMEIFRGGSQKHL